MKDRVIDVVLFFLSILIATFCIETTITNIRASHCEKLPSELSLKSHALFLTAKFRVKFQLSIFRSDNYTIEFQVYTARTFYEDIFFNTVVETQN